MSNPPKESPRSGSNWHGASPVQRNKQAVRKDFLSKVASEASLKDHIRPREEGDIPHKPKKDLSKSADRNYFGTVKVLKKSKSRTLLCSRPLKVEDTPDSPSPTTTPYTQFWSLEIDKDSLEEPTVPVLRKKSRNVYTEEERSSNVFSLPAGNVTRIDEFSFEQVREIFVSHGCGTVGLKYIHRAWDIVKKICEFSDWMESVLHQTMGFDVLSGLRDGKILCQLANAIKPGCIKEIYSDQPYGHLENLHAFLSVCKNEFKLSLVFNELELLSNLDPLKVIDSLHDLARAGHFLNDKIPTLREKLPDSKYSRNQVTVAVEYTITRMKNHLVVDPVPVGFHER